MRTYCFVCRESADRCVCALPDITQQELFGGEAYARSGDPDTSHQAAARVDVTRLQRQVLEALRRLGGAATSTEIAAEAGVDKWSISPRMKPLEKVGLVERTEERRDQQIVWRLK